MKLGKLNSNGTFYIALPKRIVMAKGWQYGDELEVEIDNKGNLVIKKKI